MVNFRLLSRLPPPFLLINTIISVIIKLDQALKQIIALGKAVGMALAFIFSIATTDSIKYWKEPVKMGGAC